MNEQETLEFKEWFNSRMDETIKVIREFPEYEDTIKELTESPEPLDLNEL